MKDKSPAAWFQVTSSALFICFIIYSITGTFGYLTFGSSVNPDVLQSYPADDPLVLTARILMAVANITSYPVLHFCGRAAFFSVTGLTHIHSFGTDLPDANQKRKELQRRLVVTGIWFSSTLALALTVPNISDVISVIGSLAAFFILIFPGMVALQIWLDSKQSETVWDKLSIGPVLVVFGTWIFGVTFTLAIVNFG